MTRPDIHTYHHLNAKKKYFKKLETNSINQEYNKLFNAEFKKKNWIIKKQILLIEDANNNFNLNNLVDCG